LPLFALVRRHPLAAILALALLLGLAFQGTRGLLEPDEGRYTNVALQMLQTGDFVTLRRNAEALHFTKPPVTYWAIAGSVAALGYNEWAVRLPMALAFTLCAGLLFAMGKRLVPARPWLPALIFISSPIPFIAANTINTDFMLTAMEALAMCCYVQARFGNGSRWWIDGMWAAFGLAFLTKGPPSLLPLLALVVFHVMHRRPGLPLLRPLGLLAFALIGFGWFAVVTRQHPGLMDYFLGHEVYARVATDKLRRFPEWWGPLVTYLPTLTLGALPWLVMAIVRARRDGLTRWRALGEERRLLWLWFLIPLLIFCIARSRLPLYVLPLFVPLSLLLAGTLRDVSFKGAGMVWLAAWLVVLVAFKAAVGFYWVSDKDARLFAERLRPLLPGKPGEFLFVEDTNRNGLNLYYRVDVERLSFRPTPYQISDSDYDHTVADEFAERDTGRIFIMKSDVESFFLDVAKTSHVVPIRLGDLPHLHGDSERDRVVYTLEGDFPPR
jgi:4-amino-4-deoxy-L-arabinose transferase-like glycosyltransferase